MNSHARWHVLGIFFAFLLTVASVITNPDKIFNWIIFGISVLCVLYVVVKRWRDLW